MKKLYTMLLGAAIPLMGYADAKTVPYQSTFYQDEEWVVHNLNNDDKTWDDNDNSTDFSSSGFSVGKTYHYHRDNQADDWLIGPAIHLEAGKQYKVKFYLRTQGSDAEDVTLYIGTSDQPAELKESTALIEFVDHKDTAGAYHAKAFTVPATGDYHFGIYAYSPKYRYNIKITGFQVREDVFTPGAPTNLTVIPGADRALQARLAWSLPVKDLDGEDIPAGYTYDEVRITRDGVLLNTPQLAGDATEFTDTEAYGLTSGKHTYEVVSVVNGAASPAATVVSRYIGPIAPMAIPFLALTDTWSSDDDFETLWSTDKGRGSDQSQSWSLYSTTWGDIVKSLRYYSSTSMDEWLISPPMNFAEAGVYRVSYNASFATEASTLTMYTGTGTTLGGYTDAFAEITGKLVKDSPVYGYISVDTPCRKQLAFHTDCSSTGWNYYDIYDIKVEKWHLAPAQIADLAASVSDDGEQVILTWTNPSTTNTGDPLAAITKHIVYCDGEMIATVTDNLTPGAAASYTHTAPAPGIHTYYVDTYSGDEKADGTPMQVTSAWVGDESQTVPYSTYFTDATRPIWTGFDGNADGITFVYPDTDASSKPTLAKVSEVTQHDDYLLSPYFNIDKPGYYNVRFAVAGGAYGYKLEMGHVADKKNVAASFVKTGDDFSMNGNYSSSYFEQMFRFDAPGRYAMALHTVNTGNPATSSDRAIEVSQFLVEYVPVNPARPDDFTASPAPGNELKAVLKWTNPTESNFEGVTPVIAKAVISRKQGYALFEEVGVVTEGLEPGEEFTWYDETLTTPGIYKYQVVLEGPEGKDGSAYAQATTTWVGPGYSLPVSVHMDDSDPDLSSTEWSIYNVNGDSNYYVGEITWEKLSGSIGITSNNAEDTDDWAIHGFYQFDKGDEYKFTVRNYTSNTTTTDWELWLGDSDHYDGMTVKLADITTPAEQYVKEDHSFILVVTDGADDNDAPEAQSAGDNAALPRFNVAPGATAIGLHLAQRGQVSVSGFAFEVLKRAVRGVVMSQTEAELLPGATLALTATVMPEDATDKTVTWTSSDEAVATVDAEGNVTAVAPGQAEITATSNGFIAVCDLTVSPVKAQSVTLSASEAELTEGDTFRLTAEVAPADVTDKTVTWTSSDEAVATVDASGLVTAVAPGSATVTASCGEASATCEVTVNARVIEVTGITLDKTSIFGAPGNSEQLSAEVTPANATDETVTWTSSDEAVATVDANGLVAFIADGEAVITASCGGFSATCDVKVVSSGLALIPADMRNDARVYTLGGVEVKAENLNPGFYIVTYLRDGVRVSSKIRL